jgi:hypothetical protein
MEVAGAELDALDRRRVSAALEALLAHCLRAYHGPGAFLAPAAPELSSEDAWRLVLEAPAGPALPLPAESPLDVALRLLEALAANDPGGGASALGSARLRAAAEGPAAGETAFRALLGCALGPKQRHAAVAGVVGALLSRGRVGEALAFLGEHLDLVAVHPDLAWRLVWCRLLLGDEAGARAAARGLEPYAGELPQALLALRELRPAWLSLLPGRSPAAGSAVAPSPSGRLDLGASVLAVFALGPAHEALSLHLDVAPALRAQARRWAEERDGAAADLAAPEHALVAQAAPVARHREGAPLAGCLDPRSLAHVLVPVLFGHGGLEGEVAGWIALEFAHHLLPADTALAALAERWRGPVLEAAWQRRGRAAEAAPGPGAEASEALAADDLRVVAVQAFLDGLGLKTSTRRWWFFDAGRGPRRLVAEGGGALFGRDVHPGRGSALVRAHSVQGLIDFDEENPALAWHAQACSGVVVPVRGPRGVEALLAVESTRRRDFRDADKRRLADGALAFHDRWVAARFAAWHEERFDEALSVEPAFASPLAVVDALTAGRARMSAAIVGPPGAGRAVVARWLHHEGAGPAAPLIELSLEGLRELPVPRGEAAWIVRGLELAPLELQAELQRRLAAQRVRVFAVLANEPAESQRLHAGLAAELARLVVRVAPLAERRNAIPGIARVLARRIAASEGLAPLAFQDDAIALLWRQSWARNTHDLEALVTRAALLHPGAAVGAPELAEVARRLGQRLLPRLASRHPHPRDVRAAVEATRRATGALNKTRAASYLGWDPDTLSARLADLGWRRSRAQARTDSATPGPGDEKRRQPCPLLAPRRVHLPTRRSAARDVAPPGANQATGSRKAGSL